MKKSKFLKSLIALAVGIVAAISCVAIAACGGGDPEVNSVSLNKPTLSLTVGANETLVATTDPAGVTVTWSSSDSSKAEVDQTGKVTAVAAGTAVITAKAGEKTATCNVTVTATGTGTGTGTEKLGGTFSWQALVDEIANNLAGFNAETPDKTALKAEYFTGDNAFLTLTAEANSNVLRGKDSAGKNANLKCIEIKDGALSVTFTGTGTLTVGFSSTGGSNTSGVAVKDSAGACLTGTTTATLIGSEDTLNAGFYQVTGTSITEVTFNITAAGTYTIWGGIYNEDSTKPSGVNNARATRIHTVVMVDNGANA